MRTFSSTTGRTRPRRSGPLHRAIDTWIGRPGLAATVFVCFLVAACIPAAFIFENAATFNNNDPGSEGQRAQQLHGELTGERLEPEVILLAERGAASSPDPARASRRLLGISGVESVETIELRGGGLAILGTLSPAGGKRRSTVGEKAEEVARQSPDYEAAGVAVASHRLESQSERETRIIEAAVAPVLFLFLFVIFRGAVAALLPLVVGGSAIALTFGALSLLTEVRDIDVFALQTVTALGAGLAIDYSLFILARYREERLWRSPRSAMRVAYSTAGRTVVFSALTIGAALLALTVFPSPFLRSSGLGAALVAVSAGFAALTVLPAVMLILDQRLLGDGPSQSARPPLMRKLISASVTRPVALPALGTLIVVAMAVPALNLDLTIPDAEALPADDPSRVAAEKVLARSPLPPTTLTVVAAGQGEDVRAARRALAAFPTVSSVGPLERLPDGFSHVRVNSSAAPLSPEGQAFVAQVRSVDWPAGTLVGGRATELNDQEESISRKLPIVIAILIAATLALLLVMTRSLRVALLAVLMNLLTVCASLGILVAVFQSELLEPILGFESLGAIDLTVPALTSAAIFGLSTDYGIFVLSRVNEAGGAGHIAGGRLVDALNSTTRLVSAAAIVFAVALGAFMFSELIFVKQISLALVSAVLIDAFIVRPLIIPGVLQLLAERGPALPTPPNVRV